MPPRIFIDGHVGTTGLRIRDLLATREDLVVVSLSDDARKDAEARRAELQSADIAILCLPDDAAREAVSWAGSRTRIIDASTAHRVDPGWTYGLPELSPSQRASIASAQFVANPGCYPTAVILLLRPLIDAGLLRPSAPITVHALSGYSGGGRPMIERWESPTSGLVGLPFEAPYALDRTHKHIPEMTRYSGLAVAPYFRPAVGPFRCGMRVEVPLHASVVGTQPRADEIWRTLADRYASAAFVQVMPLGGGAIDDFSFDPRRCHDTNRIELHVLPHPGGHLMLMGILDNLGKGASGAAVQSMNLMLGLPETTGLA